MFLAHADETHLSDLVIPVMAVVALVIAAGSMLVRRQRERRARRRNIERIT